MFCARLFICALWSPAGKWLTPWLSFVMSTVSLSLSHWYPGSGVVLDWIDSWSLHPYLHCNHNHIAVTPNRWIRHICDSRTKVVRLSHESLANVSRHSCDIRETLARCSPDEIASIYYHRPPHDVLTNVVRLSCDCRAKVVRLSHDGFARNDKPRKK